MIVKNFEINKLNFNLKKIFLFYGKNEGLKNETIRSVIKNKKNINYYEEKEIIENLANFYNEIVSNSLFEEEKIFVVKRATDKLEKILQEITEKNLSNTLLIVNAENLEKKSKLRNLFEKNKDLVITPFYQDDVRSLMPIISEFLNKNKIKLSRESINLLIDRSSGDRNNLKIELDKIFYYSLSNKKIDFINVEKLTNLSENYAVGELADHYLSKNTRKVAQILNENNYSDDDCILIIRTILSKSKRLLGIIENYNDKNNI